MLKYVSRETHATKTKNDSRMASTDVSRETSTGLSRSGRTSP